jgi:uncharacterized protein (TIGR00369 family)
MLIDTPGPFAYNRPTYQRRFYPLFTAKTQEEAIVEIATHQEIDARLCGQVVSLSEDHCSIALHAREEMRADASGLIHGGFVFGLADYAAMVAVNHPNVVLGAAETKFLKPVQVGDRLQAEAHIQERQGKKIFVAVTVKRGAEEIFQGLFTCFVPPRHVLAAP